MKHKRDDGAEKQDEETVDVTPIMICVFVVMCCSMLVLLYFFYDYLGTAAAPTQHAFQHTASVHLLHLAAPTQFLSAQNVCFFPPQFHFFFFN